MMESLTFFSLMPSFILILSVFECHGEEEFNREEVEPLIQRQVENALKIQDPALRRDTLVDLILIEVQKFAIANQKLGALSEQKNSSSYILRQILVPLSIRQKVFKIENRNLDIKGVIPSGVQYMDEDVDVLKRKYRWAEMIKRRCTSDMHIRKLDEYLTGSYNDIRKCLEKKLIEEKCEERENNLNKKLDEIKEFHGEIMKNDTDYGTSEDMQNRLLIMKAEFKGIKKNFNKTCTKAKNTLENLTYDNFTLDFSHSLAYYVENTNDIIAHLGQMGLKMKESLKLFDSAIDPFVTIYNAVVSSEGAQPPINLETIEMMCNTQNKY